MIEIAAAWALLEERAAAVEPIVVELAEAAGLVLAQDVGAPIDLPPFDRSAMDGYAIRAGDAAQTPVTLRLVGEVVTGAAADTASVGAGEAVRISTGAALPPGADAVVMQEHTSVVDESVQVRQGVTPGANIRRRGEDVRAGSNLAAAGDRLHPGRLGLLAGSGIVRVQVHRRPRVGVLVTGSELVARGGELASGQIFESNGVTLRALVAASGAEVLDLGTAPDEPAAIAAAIRRGVTGADLVLITGGVSVGDHDHVRDALASAGVEELFWRVRMKPGKPIAAGVHRDGTIALGLPGNPLSAVVGWLLFGAPLVRIMGGGARGPARHLRAVLAEPMRPDAHRPAYVTARLVQGNDGTLEARAAGPQGSAMTRSLAEADGFVLLEPGDAEVPAGATVQALMLEAIR